MEILHRNLCQLFPDNPCRLVSNQIEFEVKSNLTVKILDTSDKCYYVKGFDITLDHQIFLERFERCLDEYKRIHQLKSILQPLFDFYKVVVTVDHRHYTTLKFRFRDISFTGKSFTSVVDIRGIFDFITLTEDNCVDTIKTLFTQQILKHRADYLSDEYILNPLDLLYDDNLTRLVFTIVNQQTELLTVG